MFLSRTIKHALLFCLILLLLPLYNISAQVSECNCTDYLYVNDEYVSAANPGLVHKFEINTSSGALTEIPAADGTFPFIDNPALYTPHGLAIDNNGNVYIGRHYGGDNEIHKFNCEGELLAEEFIPAVNQQRLNYGSANGILYEPDWGLQGGDKVVKAYDLCDGSLIGRMQISSAVDINVFGWGFHVDENYWYLDDYAGSNCVFRGLLDPSLYNAGATNSGTQIFCLGDGPNMGITSDAAGNLYVVHKQDRNGAENNFEIRKYSATGTLLASAADPSNGGAISTPGQPGFWGARGLAFSNKSGYLYVGSFENCVTVFDANLNELSTLNVPNPAGGLAKGVSIATVCCPVSSPLSINKSICSADANGQRFFLNDLFGCDGPICEGLWTETMNTSGGAITFNDCNLSVNVSGAGGCATYNLMSDGTGNKQCGPLDMTMQICIEDCSCTTPTASISAVQPTCSGGSDQGNGYFQVNSVSNGDRVNVSTGTIYSGDSDYANATTIGALPFQFSTGLGNSDAGDYTVRIFNGASGCFTDETITMASVDCTLVGDCSCTEYLYMAELDVGPNYEQLGGRIHKWVVNADGTLTPQIVNPVGTGESWLPGGIGFDTGDFLSPHGVVSDLNGYLYIGETTSGDIRKVSCDGTVLPESDFVINTGAYNFGTIDNTIYIPQSEPNANGVDAYSLCDGSLLGTICINNPEPNLRTWGFWIDPNTDEMFLTGQTGRIYKFNASDLGGTCIDPLTNMNVDVLNGITTDPDGNIYVAQVRPDRLIMKLDPAGNLITTINIPNEVHGIYYSPVADRIYTSYYTDVATDPCIISTDLNLTASTTEVFGNGEGFGKALTGLTQCCPNTTPLAYTETICNQGNGEKVFLQDLFSCGDGVICEGEWSVQTANTNQVFNDCDLSITVNGSGCGTYVLEKTTPATGNQQCDPFTVTVNICTEVPSATLTPSQGTCTGTTPNNDATIAISAALGDEANFSTGASYTGAAYGGAGSFAISSGTGSITGLVHNTQYTVRVFNGANDCFTDETITMPSINCNIPCPDPNCFGVSSSINN